MKNKKSLSADLDTIIPHLIGVWRRFLKISGPPDRLQTREFRSVVSAIKTLLTGLEQDKSLLGKDYFENQDILAAYLLYPWVIHYLQGLSLLGELPITPRRVLDICSGPAPLAFAALRHGAQEVIATDRNLKALELGAEVCGRYGFPITLRKWICAKEPMPDMGKFDLIILSHCLEELFPAHLSQWNDKQNRFIQKLLEQLTPNGFLLIVDGSFLESNRRILQIRDHFVENGIPVQAPCVWKGPCPALQTANSPCYAQREFDKPHLIKEIQRASNINLSSLKMSYIIFKSPGSTWPVLEKDKKYYRTISPPVESFQGKRFYLCGTDGKKNLGSHFKEQPVEAKAFDFLRRGELISLSHALERNHFLDIIQGTHLKVEAACGKPIPEEHKDDG